MLIAVSMNTVMDTFYARAGLFKAGLRKPRVTAKFEVRYESLKSKFSLILFNYNLMTGYFKKNIENYPR